MKKIIFIFHNIWRKILYEKFISIVLLSAMVIGFFFPLTALNDVNNLLADGHLTVNEDASHIAVIDYYMAYKEESEMYASIDSARKQGLLNEAGFSAYERQIIYAGDQSYSGSVSGISERYLALNAYELLTGELFSEEDYAGNGEKVCLVGYQGSLVKNGIKAGDTIQILGDTYKIKGLIRAPRIYGGILIPYAMTPELFTGAGDQVQYQVITYGDKAPNPRILAFKLFPEEDVLSAQTGVQQEASYSESMFTINRYRILRAAIVIGFTVLNLFILLSGMFVRDRYSITIRLALGADSATVRIEAVARNLCIMFAALMIDFFLYTPASGMINGTNAYLQPITVLEVCAGGLLIVTATSSISYSMGLRKQRIAFLLKKM